MANTMQGGFLRDDVGALVLSSAATSSVLGTTTASENGAVGDGVTDDTAALRAAAATGKHVVLEKGKTYLVNRYVKFTTNYQALIGNGATIKRAAQFSITTTSAITSGSTTAVTVADASAIRVGMEFMWKNSGGTFASDKYEVLSVVGNVVTFTAPLTITATGGTTSTGYLAFRCAWFTGLYQRVENVIFEGNVSNTGLYASWTTTQELHCGTADHFVAEGCTFQNCAGDAFLSDNSTDLTVLRCRFLTINGNGYIFGGTANSYDNRVIGCWFKDINLNPLVGHADGCVSMSNAIRDLLVADCHADNALALVGGLNTADNSGCTIVNNEARNMTNAAIDMQAFTGDAPTDVIIEGNRFYNCVRVFLTNGGGSGATVRTQRVRIANNILYETTLQVLWCDHIDIQGNTITWSTTNVNSPAVLIQRNRYLSFENNRIVMTIGATVQSDGINSVGNIDSTIAGNIVVGGSSGININDANTANLLVARNRCRQQLSRGITIANASATSNVRVYGNEITVDSTATTTGGGYAAIRTTGNATIEACNINMTSGQHGILVNSGGGHNVLRNTVRRLGASGASISITNVITSAMVRDNGTDAAISDSSAGVATLVNNFTLV